MIPQMNKQEGRHNESGKEILTKRIESPIAQKSHGA
jgi:hypothetical protein